MSETKGVKVFAGNLSYSTNSESLKQHFQVYGNVLSSIIITRKNKSIGYGFVDFESEEDAKKAVQELNHKALDGREINVELAKPREPREPREPRPPRQRAPRDDTKPRAPRDDTKPRPQRRRHFSTSSNGNSNTPQSAEDEGFQQVQRRQNKERKPQVLQQQQNTQQNTQQKPQSSQRRKPQQQQQTSESGPKKETPKPSSSSSPSSSTEKPKPKPKQQTKPEQTEKKVEASSSTSKSPRRRNKNKKQSLGEDTSNGLFVANIPYSFSDEQFRKLFEDKGFKVGAESKVIRRKRKDLPTPGPSLGYGFLYVQDKDEQAKVLQQFNNLEITYKVIARKQDNQEIEKKRTISVKIAKSKIEEQQ